MPELPEVECLRQTLLPHLKGQKVIGVQIHRADICECVNDAGKTVPVRPTHLLKGDAIHAITRKGKQLAISGESGSAICVHLGMSGSLIVHPDRPTRRAPHTHITWTLSSGSVLEFRDPRRFGGIWTFPNHTLLHSLQWKDLGPDALEVTGEHLQTALGTSSRMVKAALLDQSVVAGVGNIYADEALFLANICPRSRCSRLKGPHWQSVAHAVRDTLAAAITAGGSTIRDYRNADGAQGTAQTAHRVYGRAGQPCVRCGQVLRRGTIAQRTTVWCHSCQPPV